MLTVNFNGVSHYSAEQQNSIRKVWLAVALYKVGGIKNAVHMLNSNNTDFLYAQQQSTEELVRQHLITKQESEKLNPRIELE